MNMNLHLIPGPMDDRMLYLGAEHRARNLFLNPQEGESCTMDFRCGDGSFWELIYDKHITLTGKVLSWGAAALASLYREPYKGTNPQKSIIGGPMSLLQIWAWTRIHTLAPRIVDEQIDWRKPYGARWVDHNISRTETPSHVIKAHRTTLRNLREADFDWMPYRDVMQRLLEMCKTGINSWKSRCFLIYWNVVEYHPVERVMRQFGFLQEVPAPFPFSREVLRKLRKTQRKGRLETDWSVHHALYVENWNHRRENMVEGVPTNTPTAHHTYNDWFHRHTVLYIKDPRQVHGVIHTRFDDHGGTARYLVDGLGFIGQEALRMRNMGPDHYYENFGGVQSMASQLVGSINHIDQPSYIQTNEPDLGPDNTHPQRAPRDRGRRGRQRTRVNLVQNDDKGEGARHFEGATFNYGEGTSNWEECYRPSSQFVGHGSSNIQLGTQLNVNNNQQNNWVSSLFDCTPSSNVIPAMYSDQQGPFQNYDYTGLSVQQPRYEHLTPVQINLDLQMTQPESSSPPNDNEPEQPQPRRIQPRRSPKPVGCGTAGCLMCYPHRH
ncbi:hypothetical protein E3N88_38137 [Mikania micrantha]|uniref:Aminotransferase-like plant mobile domain-containing protein n=1 Tax=Mikania micrantha TaxID=192012 RepID=A0A5N6LTF4_9ASTR|nr:hypothetical protein E3N88_38137 [Mikania micrantha]